MPGGYKHKVKPKDTLWSISKKAYKSGEYWWLIRDANKDIVSADGTRILIGTTLIIPYLTEEVEISAKRTTKRTPKGTVNQPKAGKTQKPEGPIPKTKSKKSASSAGSSSKKEDEGVAPALKCMYPALKYELDHLPSRNLGPIVTPSATIECTLSLTGEVVLQKEGSCNPFVLDQRGYSAEATKAFRDLTATFKIANLNTDKATIGCELTGPLGSQEVAFQPPNTFIYGRSPGAVPVKSVKGWEITAKIGYKLEVSITPRQSPPQPAPSPGFLRWVSDNAGYIVGGVLIIGAGVVVIGTLVEDVVTGGVGVADDAVSFAAAAQMFRIGVAFF